MPFQIESLKLTKVGPFDNFEAHFRRNFINLIHGTCGSGESTIIRSILYAFSIRHRYFTEKAFDTGTISVKVFPGEDSINIKDTHSSQNTLRGYKCLIADDPLERIPKDMIVPLFAELKHLGIQIILTASLLIDTFKLSNGTHVIPLETDV